MTRSCGRGDRPGHAAVADPVRPQLVRGVRDAAVLESRLLRLLLLGAAQRSDRPLGGPSTHFLPHAMQACLMSAAFRRAVLSSALTRADEQSQQRAQQLGQAQHAKRAHTIDTLAPEATTAWRRKQLQLVAMAAAARVGEEARARQQYRAGVLGSTLDLHFSTLVIR